MDTPVKLLENLYNKSHIYLLLFQVYNIAKKHTNQ